ncbi:hypothetical protein BU25DRAFT_456128 [Macroventuria anomochaeta]|uniref:Uncharacterized protein n=1 Tax=Macroventuria anomochaeta TaxID=301207 RepID=A0ACB6SAP5_9PLEO|nr:uncharacterized protein BU25DRAFT_456128 [Macroventuria anomochaeta]KAF2630389.1 hypothetical protein BU25DRAFT_456128 [Macroventuria anomochaeta]
MELFIFGDRKAFDGSFKEADERSITLVDVTEQTFRIFLQWAYAQMSQAQLTTIPLCKDLQLIQDSAKSGAAVPPTTGTTGRDDESDSSMASDRNAAPVAAFDEGAFHYDPEGLGRTRYWKNNE